MLYLNRKIGETIVINNEIHITISEIKGNKSVKVGCHFPPHVTLLRKEIHDKISSENFIASSIDINVVNELMNGEKNAGNL